MGRNRRIPLLLVLVAGVLALGGPASEAARAKKPGPQTVPGELLIGFRSDLSASDQQKLLKSIGGAERKSFKRIHGALVEVQAADVTSALESLRKDPRVRYAEPNYIVTADQLPNDPSFGNTWGLNNTGQAINGVPGTADADIDAPEAWNVTTGSPAVKVAVIDTGVDFTHPDLASQIWINPGENCAGCRTDGIDNDANGYVDDWHGWNFVANTNNPMDDHGHGTHVAGTIGASGNNGIGVAGVNWNVKIMPVKFLNAQGSGTIANAVSAVLYASQNGADVMNNSWAGPDFSQALADAIGVADQRNSLFVAAAGNNGTDNDASPTYPASFDNPNVLAVAATDNKDNRAYFSNIGRSSVDIGAPGVDIYSTWRGNAYQFLSGTSMATPQVAGAAALAKAAFPSATAVGLKDLLLNTADPRPSLAGVTTSGARLNVGNAVACSGAPQAWIDSPANGFGVDVGKPISFSAVAANCASASGVTASATMNGAPISMTARGDGLYTGSFTPSTGGSITLSVTATVGGSSVTRSVTGNAKTSLTIAPGGPPVTVTSSGETVPVRFIGTAGERVSLALSNVTMMVGQASFVSPSGATLASTYVGSGGGFVDATTLPTNGTYTINVAPLFGSGSMTLTLYDVPPDATAAATPGGSAVALPIGTPGQNGRITFNATAGQRVSLQLSNVTISFATLSILRPDGSSVSGGRYFGSGSTFVDTTTLSTAGTYTILLDPQGAAVGSANVQIYDVPPDAGGPITLGSPVSIATTVPGQNARLTFSGTAGQRISMRIANSTFASATATLLGPNGASVGGSTFFGTSGGFVDARTLPSTGTYVLAIDPPYATTGSATIALYDVPPDLDGIVSPGGGAVTANISTPGQNAKYTFTGTAGQRISATIGPSTMSMGFLSITGPNGSTVVGNTIFSTYPTFIDTRTLPTTGTYTITLDPYNDTTGSATVTLYDVSSDASGTLTVGGPAQAISIATPGQNGKVTFGGTAGQPVKLTISGVSIAISFVSILKPDGTVLVNGTLVGEYGRTINTTTPVDGLYTIYVDPQYASTGNMTLGLVGV
jgi:large repetitive protein